MQDRNLTLFDNEPDPAPVQGREETSKQAAAAIAPVTGKLRKQVLRCIKMAGAQGATDQEVQGALSMSGDTQRRCRQELEKMGAIVRRATPRQVLGGRTAIVWIINKDQ